MKSSFVISGVPKGDTGATGLIAVYNSAGTPVATPHVVTGIAYLPAGATMAGVTFSGSATFTNASSYVCTATPADPFFNQFGLSPAVLNMDGATIFFMVESPPSTNASFSYICVGN